MLSLPRLVSAVVAVAVILALTPMSAHADGVGGVIPPECTTDPGPGCDIGVGTPGDPGSDRPGGGDGVCRSSSGAVIPCERDGAWAGSDGCYYKPADLSPETIAALGGQPAGPGDWYQRECYSADGSSILGSIVWLGTAPAVSPAILAREARAHLSFPEVVLGFSPAGTQLVGVPVWVSLSSGWQVRSATASVPALSVTATARPTQVVIDMGDGTTIVCAGPGTAFRPGLDDPAASSPDCGATYRRSSAGQPGEVFVAGATITWAVTWVADTGQSGAVPGLTTTGTTTVRVAEGQTVILG